MPDLDCLQKNSKNNWFFNELKYHGKLLLKSLPLVIGYVIFLFYFIQNDFFPNMDIFNWGSLLIASFISGLLLLFILIYSLIFVGYYWSALIVNDKIILKQLGIHKGQWLLDENHLRKITDYYLFTPLIINHLSLGFIGYISKISSVTPILFFLLPMLLGGISAAVLYYKLRLPCELFFKYFLSISMLVFFSSFFCIICAVILQDNISKNVTHSLENHSVQVLNKPNKTTATHLKNSGIEDTKLLDKSQSLNSNFIEPINKYLNKIIFLIFIVINALLVRIITLLLIKKNIWSVLGIIIGFICFLLLMTNVGKNFPAKVVETLNIGNYQASQVYLTPESCQHLKETQLFEISQQCSLENIKVLWDIGGSYFFKVAVNGELQILSLDKKEIIAVLKSKKPSTACRTQPPEAPVDNSINQ